MKQKLSLWNKFGCFLTGWDKSILEQSTQASITQLNKYTSALLILIMIWGVTGFCFAQRYIELPVWGCCLVALACIIMVIMIERQILLTSKKSAATMLFRGFIAIVMAFIGSTIFDQTLFGKDIDKVMMMTVDKEVATLVDQQTRTINAKIAENLAERDSLNKVNTLLQEDINLHPIITMVNTETVQEKETTPDGTVIIKTRTIPTKTEVPNPKIETVKGNNEKIQVLQEREKELTDKLLKIEEETRADCLANVGFLNELEAMWTLIMSRRVALVFYLAFFSFIMFMELFVVIGKFCDEECDYLIAVRRAREIRLSTLHGAPSLSY